MQQGDDPGPVELDAARGDVHQTRCGDQLEPLVAQRPRQRTQPITGEVGCTDDADGVGIQPLGGGEHGVDHDAAPQTFDICGGIDPDLRHNWDVLDEGAPLRARPDDHHRVVSDPCKLVDQLGDRLTCTDGDHPSHRDTGSPQVSEPQGHCPPCCNRDRVHQGRHNHHSGEGDLLLEDC